MIQEVLRGFANEGAFRTAREAMLALPRVESPLSEPVVLEAVALYRSARRVGLTGIDAVAVRLLFPAGAVGLAWLARERGFGLLHEVELPAWFEFSLSILALDLIVYLQHVVFHAVPVLWGLHMVHHADLDFDVTTGNRFHPVEILLSMVVKEPPSLRSDLRSSRSSSSKRS